MDRKRIIPILCFGILMAGLGSSDSLRGIFAPVFQSHYQLTGNQLSAIVTVSYLGNLLFLSVGGKLLDTFRRKTVIAAMIAVWAGAALLNRMTDRYFCILLSMFFGLGASTLLNTAVNIVTPSVFAGYAGLMVNLLFFLQGVGTSASQLLLGRYAFHFGGWRLINLILVLTGILALALLALVEIPAGTPDSTAAGSRKKETGSLPGRCVFWIFTIMMGCYFIGEHGIMNWLLSYCLSALSMEASEASAALSLFWGGMTVGRLMFAPLVQHLGSVRSMKRFGGLGTLMFAAGCVLGSRGVWILGASGLVISILYPTMVLLIQQIYPAGLAATRTGAIISLATVADIAFNTLFGEAASRLGYRVSFMILPVCMILFYILYLRLIKEIQQGGREDGSFAKQN